MTNNNLSTFKSAIYRIDNKNGFIHLKSNGCDISLRTKQWAKAHASEFLYGIVTLAFKGELDVYEPWILDYITDCLAGIHKTWEHVARDSAYCCMAYDRVPQSNRNFKKYYDAELKHITDALGQ